MAKIPINISLATTSVSNGVASTVNLNLSNRGGVKGYFNLTDLQSGSNIGVSAGNNKDWSDAWKIQQRKNVRRNRQREHYSDPSPLLSDVISSLPLNSSRRRSYENLYLTLDGTASNVGYGLDMVTRESYRDLIRLSKQSEMIHQGMRQPLPLSSQILGSEEGTYVSNIQDWRPAFANAGRRVSDAMGSHSDMEHALIKDSCGHAAFIPSACMSLVDNVSSFVGDQIEGAFKFVQTELMKHMPSKVSGSLRQLSTALDSILSVPFEIASDVYNGLMRLVSELADLLDSITTKIFSWIIGGIGGLIDGLFPAGMLDGLMSIISVIADEFGDLFDLFGGFSIVSSIKDVFSNIASGNLLGTLRSAVNLGKLLMSGIGSAMIVGGRAGIPIECLQNSKLSKLMRNFAQVIAIGTIIDGVLGMLPLVGKALGNLGTILGQTVKGIVGAAVSIIRNLGGIIAGLLPAGLNYILSKLFAKLCGVGNVGNLGFSSGAIFDNHRNRAFERAMYTHAAHAAIVAPLFNKQVVPRGSYANEPSLTFFEDSPYARGAQSAKGVAMVGPGGSITFRPFGLF